MLRKLKHLNNLKAQSIGLEALLSYFPELRYNSLILDAHNRVRITFNLKKYWFMSKIKKIV